jgi:hypothetical protein
MQEEVKSQSGLWEAAVEEAAGPLRAQLAELHEQHSGTTLAVCEVREALTGAAAKDAELEAIIGTLQVGSAALASDLFVEWV